MKHIINKRSFCLFMLLTIAIQLRAKHEEKPPLPKIGNFLLPTSQWQSQLFGFGQTLIGAKVLQLFTSVVGIKTVEHNILQSISGAIFGFTDNFSAAIAAPVFLENKVRSCNLGTTVCSKGLSDLFFLAEYGIYNKETDRSATVATLVGQVLAPTGNPHKIPPTGAGSATGFFGATLAHMRTRWYGYVDLGGVFRTRFEQVKPGNLIIFDAGFAVNFGNPWGKTIFNGMLELNFAHENQTQILGTVAPVAPDAIEADIGAGFVESANPPGFGNTMFLSPSLFFATKRWFVQLGVQIPVLEPKNLTNKNSIRAALLFVLTI